MEEVAARQGVGKATVYRRWRSRGALALDAFMAEFQALQPLPDTGTLRSDLLGRAAAWVRAVTRTPAGRILAGLIAAAQEDPELAAAWRARVLEPMRAQHRIMLRRAIERGEIPASTDTDVALDLLYGAAYHRLLQGHRPLSDTFTRRVVEVIVAGLGGRRCSGTRGSTAGGGTGTARLLSAVRGRLLDGGPAQRAEPDPAGRGPARRREAGGPRRPGAARRRRAGRA